MNDVFWQKKLLIFIYWLVVIVISLACLYIGKSSFETSLDMILWLLVVYYGAHLISAFLFRKTMHITGLSLKYSKENIHMRAILFIMGILISLFTLTWP